MLNPTDMPIVETTFGPKRYLALKKSISISQVSDKQMYDEAGKKLGAYMGTHGLVPSGPWTVLYFTWDQAAGKTDLAIAFPIAGLESVDDSEFSIVDVPESKAAMDVLHGSYEGIGAVHHGLMQYATEKKYEKGALPVMAIEEYVVGPMEDPNPENWKTDVYYPHE